MRARRERGGAARARERDEDRCMRAAERPVSYADRLAAAVERAGNPCVVGIDPHLDLLPEEYALARDATAERAARARALCDYCCAVVELAAGRVPAVKLQSAFFEQLGADGALAWERTAQAARAAGLVVIGDVKRNDIASTAAAYARAYLEGLGREGRASRCDAITVNPLLGADSIEPFLELCRREEAGIYALVRTSNPGGAQFQARGEPPLYAQIADAVAEWGSELVGASGYSSVGAVVGATHPDELARLRARMPRTPFLLPGYGAQGAGAREIAAGFDARGRGALVNSSRGVLYAYRDRAYAGRAWKDASAAALEAMIADVRGALRR
jgi:orotidine-5'-phosphate decarboxylase